ncbi:hypothetical protein OsI_15954 [Oryza sativa Indica Group]|uniref:MATH domain-containing protein n=1 Tax=Oryza sativa subsp. indica TaxID=39946 RepID=B8AU02_ORYSI|nr:hypothetical protein OsI_15954 [Oryza sativa Indica Group]
MPTATGSRTPVRSASAVIADTESGQHHLKIDGYSRIKDELPTGSDIKSRSFRAGGHSWHLRYYPNGFNSDCAECISIFLQLDYNVMKRRESAVQVQLARPCQEAVVLQE